MKIQNQRILIFGDSLSHVGSDAAPEQANITSAITSSAPGAVLAGLLIQAGASAVRINARVSRSAWNFFGREDTSRLLDADRQWQPTQVIVFLGTNDLNLNLSSDAIAMAKIRDSYRAMGAEVWAIGPPSFQDPIDQAKTADVVEMMAQVFGLDHFIDARPLSIDLTVNGRSSDGVHFKSDGATLFAHRLLERLQTKPASIRPIVIATGVAILGLATALIWHHRAG